VVNIRKKEMSHGGTITGKPPIGCNRSVYKHKIDLFSIKGIK